MRIPVCLVLAALVLATAPVESIGARALEAIQVATEKLTLETKDGPRTLDVEVARDPAARERGLMYRRHLPENRGMLFDFDHEQTVLMWMKNTYIPLDMIFIGRNGKVTHIEADTEPLSEAIISSQGPAFAVLEVNAGVAKKLGLKAGDLVRHPLFAH
ncbi:hypothetical protein SAMN06265338_107121 [Rhodoblastus acidophilus]|uniref:DUF192 domain-containing protein n=1 Tax=Rhodoblastus acidophilus TaxID=1074 RepID=A0A212RU98_RHOAC|nr:DUF192 domain-containing protein [Rhodoblastus acidophilus]PPQ37349.1 hypothetical protein CKO16_14400 [Rhodoblastus acidophilus]RAI23135.1 hypothetical protein CH337_03675 [Rhodoblastus acidophilus]SNB76210.1 hypothetical protein SAMN06265338_107121 [Rhodoblastus acidophilus]